MTSWAFLDYFRMRKIFCIQANRMLNRNMFRIHALMSKILHIVVYQMKQIEKVSRKAMEIPFRKINGNISVNLKMMQMIVILKKELGWFLSFIYNLLILHGLKVWKASSSPLVKINLLKVNLGNRSLYIPKRFLSKRDWLRLIEIAKAKRKIVHIVRW